MISPDSALWPLAVLLVVIVVALLARWLRRESVEDVGQGWADEESGGSVAAREAEGGDAVEEAELDLEAYDDEDDVAPLGSSADDRMDFLERLAEDGAIALLWSPPPEPGQPPAYRVVQRDDAGGTATMPVFTSERKAFAYLNVLGPQAVAQARWYDTMGVDAAFLVQGEFDVVVNPGSPFETALNAEDRNALAEFAGVEEREPVELPPLDEDDVLGEDSDSTPTQT